MLRQFPLYAISEIWFWKIFGPGEGPGWVFHLQMTKKPRKIKGEIFSGLFSKSDFEITSF